jgi:hypothetical protein
MLLSNLDAFVPAGSEQLALCLLVNGEWPTTPQNALSKLWGMYHSSNVFGLMIKLSMLGL